MAGDPAMAVAPDLQQLSLHTPRLQLRPLAPADAPALLRLHQDAQFMRYWSSPPWTSAQQADAMVAADAVEMAAGRRLRLGIHRRSDDALVGLCALFQILWPSRRAELGYGIDPAHWRQGLMREAVGALIDLAFGPLGLNRLEADIDPANTASAAALGALGFRQEGLLRERWIVAGQRSDSALYGLLAAEWVAGRSADRPG